MLNCGWHGDYYDNKTYRLFIERSVKNTDAVEKFFGGGKVLYCGLKPACFSAMA